MKNLQVYTNKVMRMLDDISIPYTKPMSVSVNKRITRSWGQTRRIIGYNGTYYYEIKVNSILVDDEVPERELIDTLAHELIHTCNGCFDHGETWKMYAYKFNKAYGYNVSRVKSGDEIAAQKLKERRERNSYKVTCEKCGYEWHYQRWCKVTANPSNYHHKECGGKLKLIKAKNGYAVLSVKAN